MRGDPLGLGERVAVERRRVDVDPADAEAGAVWSQPVGEREHGDLAVPDDRDPVQLEPLGELLEDRLLGRRLGERGVEVGVEVVGRLEPEEPPLAAGVRRLEHGGKADRLGRDPGVVEPVHCSEARLRDAVIGEETTHHDLVGHRVRDVGADPGQAERVGDRGHDRDRAIR